MALSVIIVYKQFLNQLPKAKIHLKADIPEEFRKAVGNLFLFCRKTRRGFRLFPATLYVFTYLHRRTRLIPVHDILVLCPK